MPPQSTAKIISVNRENVRLCASAARISTTLGDAMQIFSDSANHASNSALIDKVLRSGHNSLIEHAVFTLAFSNVSVLVEQFIIEFRLASYTVKSRRYVDFSQIGYYTPDGMSDEAKQLYQSHMDFLFGEYHFFVSSGVPKEDARFVLPYSFLSNYYCTMNARELQHVLKEIYGGRGRGIRELIDLANQICEQLEELFPCILRDIYAVLDEGKNRDESNYECGRISLAGISSEPVISSSVVELAAYSDSTDNQGIRDFFRTGQGRESAAHNPRLPELIHATFIVRDISLAGLTHIVRHRMQSIIIPPIPVIDPNRFLVPPSIRESKTLLQRYLDVFARNVERIMMLRGHCFSNEAYLALSGNTLDVITSMNARELKLFFRLRCCSRAQWEIRNTAFDMLRKLRDKEGGFFMKCGPGCFTDGQCPEGPLSCGDHKTTLFD